jgi:hypothetical protein
MEFVSHTPLSPVEHTDNVLRGAMVFDRDDNRIGIISRLDHRQARPTAVIDVSGVMMLGSGLIELPLAELSLMRGTHGVVHAVTDRSRREIEAMPRDKA